MNKYTRIIALQALLIVSQIAQGQTTVSQALVTGWNLVGNNASAALDPIALFGNATTQLTGISNQVTSVWKWDAANTKWMFFAPSYDPTGLATYTGVKGYEVMSSIASGDGYWVNAQAPLAIALPVGAGQTPASQPLVIGWNLVANSSAAALDPVAVFGNVTTPLNGITSQITSVWKWDAANTKWMFFAPIYDANGLATYATAKGYAVLSSILPGDGYWVNAAAAVSFALPPTLTGIAASGGAMANATATLTCGDGSTRTATTDANGAYTFSLSGCSVPYVISVTGLIGDAQETLVSVQATARASSDSSITVNTTPVTHALAATLAGSGDPLDLVNNISAADKTNIADATMIKVRKDALVAALADALTTAGLNPATFDIVTTKFSADRTGLDMVLDNVKVQVMPTGVTMTNVGGVKVDDMGDGAASVATATAGATADLSAGTVSFTKGTDFTVALPKLPAALDDQGVGDSIRDALNACFAQPMATRGTFAAPSTLCAAVPIAADYLHDGRDGTHEFDRFLTNAIYDNAKFATPEIVRFFSNDKITPDVRALIKFVLIRADGVVESFMTVGEKSAKTNGAKMLRGNQRPFRVFVNGVVQKRTQVAANGTSPTKAKSTYYTTGISVYVGFAEGGAGGSNVTSTWNQGAKLSFVKVSGPGLPAAGLFLNPTLPGCDSYFAIVTPGTAPATATPPNCTSYFRVSSRQATATDTDDMATVFGGTNPAFAATKMADADIMNIKPQSVYKFEIWKTGNATTTPNHVFFERLRSRPYTMGTVVALDGEVDKVHWNTISADTIAAIDPTSSTTFLGGFPSIFTVKWTNAANAAPVGNVQVQTRQIGGASATTLYQDQTNVRFSANSVGLANANQNGWPTTMKTTQSTGVNVVQTISRNRFDTQLFLDAVY